LREKYHLEEQLKRKDDGSLFDLEHDSTDDIVAAIIGNVSAGKAEAIGRGLIAGVKRKQQRPAG
jgi:hypothetical protein